MLRTGLPSGTLELLILKALSLKQRHRHDLQLWLSGVLGPVEIKADSVYAALWRLEDRGVITSEPGTSENGRNAKHYRLTPAGQRQLKEHAASWERYAATMVLALRATPDAG